jgi:predicted metal-dependent enzyme (double-stranded beta helix superfamily)
VSSPKVAEFMVEARTLLESGVSDTTLEAIGRRLAQLGRESGFVADSEMSALHATDSTFRLLQSDPDGLTLMLSRFSPKEETPVHDHDSWGVACVIQGRDRYRHWALGDAGRLHILYERELGPGDFVHWLEPPQDIHSQLGVGGDALELVLFSKNVMAIPRHYYDPETGAVRTSLPQ